MAQPLPWSAAVRRTRPGKMKCLFHRFQFLPNRFSNLALSQRLLICLLACLVACFVSCLLTALVAYSLPSIHPSGPDQIGKDTNICLFFSTIHPPVWAGPDGKICKYVLCLSGRPFDSQTGPDYLFGCVPVRPSLGPGRTVFLAVSPSFPLPDRTGLTFWLCVRPPIWARPDWIRLFVCQSVRPSVSLTGLDRTSPDCLSVCLAVCPSVWAGPDRIRPFVLVCGRLVVLPFICVRVTLV